MKTQIVKAFPPKHCCFYVFSHQNDYQWVNMPLYGSDKNIDNRNFMGYLKVKSTGIPW